MNLGIIAITPRGADLARAIGQQFPEAEIFLPDKFRREDSCRYFDISLSELRPELFVEADGLLCIMATGIVVRLLAPHLRGKEHDPAVVVMDEAGRFAVSLLSGHLGGANELAVRVALASGGQAVVTTATDVNDLPAWDDLARREDLAVEPLSGIKIFNAFLLERRPVGLVDRQNRVAPYFSDIPTVHLARNFADPLLNEVAGKVFVTHRHIPDPDRHGPLLLLRPRDLIVGIGCNRGTSAKEIEEAVTSVMEEAFLAPASIRSLATVAAKWDEAGLAEFAENRKLSIDFHSAEELNRVEGVSPPSDHALEAVGAKGVCEPAALLSARGGPLLVAKKKRGNVTVAVAEIGEEEG